MEEQKIEITGQIQTGPPASYTVRREERETRRRDFQDFYDWAFKGILIFIGTMGYNAVANISKDLGELSKAVSIAVVTMDGMKKDMDRTRERVERNETRIRSVEDSLLRRMDK